MAAIMYSAHRCLCTFQVHLSSYGMLFLFSHTNKKKGRPYIGQGIASVTFSWTVYNTYLLKGIHLSSLVLKLPAPVKWLIHIIHIRWSLCKITHHKLWYGTIIRYLMRYIIFWYIKTIWKGVVWYIVRRLRALNGDWVLPTTLRRQVAMLIDRTGRIQEGSSM